MIPSIKSNLHSEHTSAKNIKRWEISLLGEPFLSADKPSPQFQPKTSVHTVLNFDLSQNLCWRDHIPCNKTPIVVHLLLILFPSPAKQMLEVFALANHTGQYHFCTRKDVSAAWHVMAKGGGPRAWPPVKIKAIWQGLGNPNPNNWSWNAYKPYPSLLLCSCYNKTTRSCSHKTMLLQQQSFHHLQPPLKNWTLVLVGWTQYFKSEEEKILFMCTTA